MITISHHDFIEFLLGIQDKNISILNNYEVSNKKNLTFKHIHIKINSNEFCSYSCCNSIQIIRNK